MPTNNSSSLNSNKTISLSDGYDLPVYGLANGQFINIHAPAITCILLSFLSATVVIIHSTRRLKTAAFFSWRKSERFIIYLAICDGLFNACHLMDHLHVLITKNHVFPKELCEFYGFMLIEFISAQVLMVNIISINGFVLIYFGIKMNFGFNDWRLLMWVFGVPFIEGIVAAAIGVLGSNGAFCYLDGVNGKVANIIFTTIPVLVILLVNSLLYILTWYRIRSEEPRFKDKRGNDALKVRASHRAARNMSLFVAAFFVQWWGAAFFCIWDVIDKDVPQVVFQFSMTFSNIGGVLNGIVYFILKRRNSTNSRTDNTAATVLQSSTVFTSIELDQQNQYR